jgi:hypothetical protein
MSEEREEERPTAGAKGEPREAPGPRGREAGRPPDDRGEGDWGEGDWDKDDWDEDGRPDEVLLAALAAEEAEWAEAEASRRPPAGVSGQTPGRPGAPSPARAGAPSVPEESQAETTRRSGIAYAAGFTLFITVVSFMGLGWLLDSWLGTRWLLVAGILVGAVAGFTQFVRIITRLK